MTELTRRILVALWGIPLLLFLTYMGGYYFLGLILILSGMASWEYYTMFHQQGIHPYRVTGIIWGTLFLLITFWIPQWWQISLVLIVVSLLLMNLKQAGSTASQNGSFTIAGFIYIPFLFSTLLSLRLNFDVWMPLYSAKITFAGGKLLLILLASIWICDTAAYFGGKKFGKHKLAPSVSPNKTIEGGGCGLVFGVLTFYIGGKIFLPELPVVYTLASGMIVGVFGQLGDLIESLFKRNAGVKDSSALLPGHGGILDRFDSLIFVSPFLWALFYLGKELA